MPRAASLVAEIKAELDIDAEVIPGAGGVFDITVDGALIYSKHESVGRFPQEGEIVRLIKLK